MATKIPFNTLFHSDWSVDAKKRWVTRAIRSEAGWGVIAPRLVGDTSALCHRSVLFKAAPPSLAGFDFPIGLPLAYGRLTGLTDFLAGLRSFGDGEWAKFYEVAGTAEEISRTRPFYPSASTSGARQEHLLRALGLEKINELCRQCERATSTRRAACPIFWTIGGNQVGKATISGWGEVIVPALRQGARLWPFEGSLASLAISDAFVLAETYPAEAYGHVGAAFKQGSSKRRQSDRRKALSGVSGWVHQRQVVFCEELTSQIHDGFGEHSNGEDRFDSFVGALSMIEVVEGRRPEKPADANDAVWEGWILGQAEFSRPS